MNGVSWSVVMGGMVSWSVYIFLFCFFVFLFDYTCSPIYADFLFVCSQDRSGAVSLLLFFCPLSLSLPFCSTFRWELFRPLLLLAVITVRFIVVEALFLGVCFLRLGSWFLVSRFTGKGMTIKLQCLAIYRIYIYG